MVSHLLGKEFSLKSYNSAAKPRLTSAVKKKKLSFSNKHFYWYVEKRETVLFFDESTFQQFAVRKRHVRKPKCQRFNAKFTVSTVKHPPSHMVWGAMSKHGTAGLCFLAPGITINGLKYVQLLQKNLNIHIVVHETFIFMHDGAPCY